ncbi:F510_1955 family glycosylhydrolase [Leptolyngbya sp. KIOST-1]|uniref:F510_1955 family glycosylhydrolase n=1 Tax=Cyanophyceae TaxID=3028117 RepID=UPI000907846F|nr:YCF48-related protein [Leptolyngbya sp. KIOST-1]PSR19204.1 hypothetical protein C8255_03480 [filamentous cyanobacterium CCP3]
MSQPNSNEGKATKWLAYVVPATIFLLILGGTAWLFSRTSQPTGGNLSSAVSQSPSNQADSAPAPTTLEASLKPAENWQTNNHIHGLTVSPDDPQIIYIASHSGLLKRSETGQWFWVKEQYDYMGFISHPTDANRFYASGHPPEGGNLGFQVSQNQGLDWQEVSMRGVDFHAMAIAPSNPDTIYGLATSGQQGFFVSNDAGQTWTKQPASGLEAVPFSLNVDPLNPERVLATTQAGLYESQDAGKTWSLIPSTATAPIAGLALQAEGDQTTMLGYRISSTDAGLYRSVDGGQSWGPWSDELEGTILYMAAAPTNAQVLYAVNENNVVFQSQDGGKTWNELDS